MSSTETKAGTATGLALSILGQIEHDVLQTLALAALGATVSFFVSRILQCLFNRKRKQ
ncbi:hypothetical protein [Pedobacter aquatilis]|uniref:hypothetical protein n=1 Tax=Pedobacter aquatilis TaxID=351343 RepID=UPI0029315340|nr:hypothetical protein [Pedobacter aquatilis]